MRRTLILSSFALLLVGCSGHKEQYVLISDRQWSLGEARACSLDGQWKEGHCFPPSSLILPGKQYMYTVNVTFEDQPQFDKDHWAGLDGRLICRLDSYERATCRIEKPTAQ
jgi:hypothetical protein